MQRKVLFLVLISVLIPTVCYGFGQDKLFLDHAPSGYCKTKTLKDCEERFYSFRRQYLPVKGEEPHSDQGSEVGKFSYFVSIGWTREDSTVEFKCGGTLITLSHVLTASSCGLEETITPDVVRCSDEQNVQHVRIGSFIRHSKFDREKPYDADIAVVELEVAVVPGPHVSTACLWTQDTIPAGTMVLEVGAAEFTVDQRPVRPIDSVSCMNALQSTGMGGISAHQFCAAFANPNACQDGIGSPVVVEGVDLDRVIPMVVGMVSSCHANYIGIYTKVSKFVRWIESVTRVSFNPAACSRQSTSRSLRKFFKSPVQRDKMTPTFRVRLLQGSKQTACGGSLIDEQHVLTSAQCVTGSNVPTRVEILDRVGDIADIIVHPGYDHQTQRHDLAVIRLKKFLNFQTMSESVLPVCLWTKPTLETSQVFVAAHDPSIYNGMPLVIETNVTSPKFCPKDKICSTSEIVTLPFGCSYENGGPLSNYMTSPTDDFVPRLYGVNSKSDYHHGNKGKGSFMATRVASYFDWIESVVFDGARDCPTTATSDHEVLPTENCKTKLSRNGKRMFTKCRKDENRLVTVRRSELRSRNVLGARVREFKRKQ